MLRDCNNCVHATRDGGCSAWCCHGTETIDDVRLKAVREFAEWIISKKSCCGYIDEMSDKVLQEWALEWENEVSK